MESVVIYKLSVINRYYKHYDNPENLILEVRYSFYPWDSNGQNEGYDDGGTEYIIPEGYTLGEDYYGQKIIKTVDGKPRNFRIDKEGKIFVKEGSEVIYLEKKDKDSE